jgi:hypothetical protein
MGVDLGGILGGALGSVVKLVGHEVPIPGLAALADGLAEKLSGATPEQQAQIQAAINAHDSIKLEQAKLDAALIHDDDEVEKTELQSSDKFTSRARPSLLYLAGLITAAMAGAVILGRPLNTDALSYIMLPLWGHAGFYAYQRTKEKVATIQAG